MPALTGGSRTRTRVPVEARRCAPVALRQLQGLACLGDRRASAEHHAVQGETAIPLYEKGDVRIHYEEVGAAATRRGGWASHGLRRGDGLKDALRSPGRYAAGRCRLCSSCLRGEAHAEGAGVKAAKRSAARLERRRSGRRLALTQERAQRTLRRLQAGRTAAARCRPGERFPSCAHPRGLPGHGKPSTASRSAAHSPASARPLDLQRSAATGEGCGGTLPPRCPLARACTVSASTEARLALSCPRWWSDRGSRPAGACREAGP